VPGVELWTKSRHEVIWCPRRIEEFKGQGGPCAMENSDTRWINCGDGAGELMIDGAVFT